MARIPKLAKQPWVVMPTAALLVFGGWFAVQDRSSGASPSLPTEQVVQATKGTMAKTVTAQGTVEAVDSDSLAFSAAGTVTAVNVKAGQTVNAGDVLATLDSPALRQAVSDAESRVAEAKATLSDDTAASASSSRLEADRSNVTTANDALTQANANLAGAKLVAPYAAKIVSVGLTVGETLNSSGQGSDSPTGSNSGSGRTNNNLGDSNSDSGTNSSSIAVITLNAYKVNLGFDANDIGSLADGQAAKVALSTGSSNNQRGNFPGFLRFGGAANATNGDTTATTAAVASDAATATGSVYSVSSVADASTGVAQYPVVVTFNDSSGSFNPGATVQVDITISEVQDAIQVPALAVSNDGNGSTVTVRNSSGKDETRSVTTGLTSGSMIQITSGLQEGESVVIELPGLRNGTANRNGNGGTNSNSGGGNGPQTFINEVGK